MSGILIRSVQFDDQVMDLLLDGTTLTRHSGPAPSVAQVIDGNGLLAVPGLVDHHVHFRDPGLTDKEDLLSGARAAAAGGYCAVACEPNTRPVIDTVAAVQAFDARVQALGIPILVQTKSALTLGQRGEELVDIAALASVVSALSDDGEPLVNRTVLANAFAQIRAGGYALEVTAHCEETPRSAAKVRAALGDGPALSREAEIIALHLEALREHPTPLRIQHVSLAQSVALIAQAKALHLPVTAEVAPHHLLLCAEDIPLRHGAPDANWKMNPPLRSRADMLAMRRALADGTIDFIATDHAPHTPAEKAQAWDEAPFGIIGLETALGACLTLVRQGDISFARMLDAMTNHHALLTATDGQRYSCHGLTLLDVEQQWTVEPATFYSKSRNCPFAGMTFTGKAMYTIANGQLVMAEGEVLF
ncbi:MAG TPA: dihydroorotase [Armatimonadota bacterium]